MAASARTFRQLLRQYLMRDAAVSALVGGRVFGAHLSDADAPTQLALGPCLIFSLLSGQQRWHGAVQVQSFDLWGYSQESQDQAVEVYDAACNALQHTRLIIPEILIPGTATPMAGITQEIERPIEDFNDRVMAWWCRGRWKFGGTG